MGLRRLDESSYTAANVCVFASDIAFANVAADVIVYATARAIADDIVFLT